LHHIKAPYIALLVKRRFRKGGKKFKYPQYLYNSTF
jgi:hypothetical protein